MRHRLGVSGSTILSAPAQFASLFWDDIDHIEIGEFADEAAFAAFLAMCRAESVSLGIHSPLRRSIQQLARAPEVTFVFEHTPHSKASPAFVEEGYRWIRDLVGRASE